MFDTLLLNGMVIDGTGAPARRADVAISGDRVAAVAPDLSAAESAVRVDCSGLCVAPGFVDTHSHSDAYLLLDPGAPSKVSQGITTEIVGQCGSSAAPFVGRSRLCSDWATFEYPRPWHSFAEYRALLEEVRPALNVVAMVGHRMVRMGVMGPESRAATQDEVRAMERLLDEALAEGGAGLTTGLLYEPACHATPDEVEALAAVAARRGGRYATHLRSESSRLLEALDEAISLSRNIGIPLQVSHFKTSGAANWRLLPAAVERIEAARAEGLAVHADRYPSPAAGTDLDILLPDWAQRGGAAAERERLDDPATRSRILGEMRAARDSAYATATATVSYWDTVQIGGTWTDETRPFQGLRLTEAARRLGLNPAETVLWLIERDGLRTGGFFFGMSEDNLRSILRLPWVMVGSDASLRSTFGPLSADHPHPRAFGSHARFLAMARDEGLMPIEEAVRRLTGLPARVFGLRDRGELRPGAFADVVVFDRGTVRDAATYENPHQYARGIEAVFVNGAPAMMHGRLTHRRAGRLLQPDAH